MIAAYICYTLLNFWVLDLSFNSKYSLQLTPKEM